MDQDNKLEQARALISTCIEDFEFFAQRQLKIKLKSGGIAPLQLNKAQKYVHERLEEQLFERGQIRALVLKGRQQGVSTYVEARYYWKVIFRQAVRAFILTHLQEATDNLFSMVDHYHQNLHPLLRPATSSDSAKELHFERNNSGYKVSTAGSKATGRGSTIHYFHGSEVAFWPNAATHAAGVMQAVPAGNDTEIILESTANGVGGFFHEQWQKAEAGESEYIAIFVPWFWQDEYRKQPPTDFEPTQDELFYIETYGLDAEQAYWMHAKNIELGGDVGEVGWLFLQEYPFCAADAFQASGEDKICDPHAVAAARKCKAEGKQDGAHTMGVDPARFGKDRSSWIHRNRRKAYGLKSFTKLSTTQLAAKVANEIERCASAGDPIDAVFVDVVGIGAGVVDALNDMGYRDLVIPVNAGSAADDDERYYNKRVEMWDRMSEWLSEPPVEIPDVDSLHADLIALQYTFNIKQQKVLERKEEAKKRGVRSPDEGEALALTFAYPVRPKKRSSTSRRQRQPRDWRST